MLIPKRHGVSLCWQKSSHSFNCYFKGRTPTYSTRITYLGSTRLTEEQGLIKAVNWLWASADKCGEPIPNKMPSVDTIRK
eukprot:11495707-Karenia_brevis.AAC.1